MRLGTTVALALVVTTSIPSAGWAGVIQNGVEVTEASPSIRVEPTRAQLPALASFIDFDFEGASCIFLATTALRNQYAGLGVVFSGPGALDGGAILNECGNFSVSGHSPPNFVAFNTGTSLLGGGIPAGPERLDFSEDVSSIQVGVAGPLGGSATLSAYSAADVLLVSDAINISDTMQSLSVSAPGIRYAVLSAQDTPVWVFDNLSFETMPTPTQAATWGRVKNTYR